MAYLGAIQVTLALALKCADGLVLAADSRASSATVRLDYSQKFLQVNRDVGIMTYGLAVPGYRGMRAVVEWVRENPTEASSMSAIVQRARDLVGKERDRFLQEVEAELRSAGDPNVDETMQRLAG